MRVSEGMGSRLPQPPKVFDLISREELRRLVWDEHMTDADVARLYNVSSNTVNRKRRQFNLVQGALTAEQQAEIVRLAETIKTLPVEAIDQIRGIVNTYIQ